MLANGGKYCYQISANPKAQQFNWSAMDLKQVNAELKSLTIAVRDSNFHRRLNSLQKRQSIATLLIPNRLYILWSKKRKLPYCEGYNSVFKHTALANLCLEKGATLAEVQSVEDRLTKLSSE